jgi:sigma-E factor negative regulatory protein RseC
MIEEHARVVRSEGEFAWVERVREPVCSACAVRMGCGTAALAKALGRRRAQVRALNRAVAVVGDEVVIGIAEEALVRGSAALYGLPLAALLAGAGTGVWLAGDAPALAEALSIVLGLGGLAASLLWLRHGATRRIGRDPRYQPVVLRRVHAAVASAGSRAAAPN